ncbi:SprT family zinc-dependent metalloprotease [Aliiroseovarius sp. F47248L]|uniref:M48 family metallopeptidase n=1 Tax=Aliiroseovarius sp. F47248L TaxID=2926420 RepID=UPI001FF2F427|nr:SprT family zinc-dependent metalloprotease [Aliiroseovarius sp. F47248L]MCK0139497.1 M48 family metallopeptidase [Aliiroseovarius sp. F47248L]
MFWSKQTSRLTEAEQVDLAGTPEVSVILRPSARARRLSLRVSKLDGRVTLTVPHGASRREAVRFVSERADWIRKHLADTMPEQHPIVGTTLPFLGQPHQITEAPIGAARISEGTILVPPGDPGKTAARLEALLKHEARDRLAHASDCYADMVGYKFGRLTLRDTRSRWGSCSSQGNLMYSWRLVMAPEAVLDYVAAHEVAHLVHMDHSPAFWSQVATIYPSYQTPRQWLRDHGASLHRYRFRD